MSRPLKRFKFQDPTTVTLKVGPEEELFGPERQLFYPHKDLLCKASPFFQAALQGGFKEASDNVVELPDDSAQAVEDFLKWMYSGQTEHPEISLLHNNDSAYAEYQRSVQLYGFAEKIQCTELKRRLIDNFFVIFKEHGGLFPPGRTSIGQVYDMTPKMSALRRLIVAIAVFRLGETWWESEKAVSILAAVPEYAVDLAIAFATTGKRGDPFKTGAARQFYDPDMLEEEGHQENSKGIDSNLKPKKTPKPPARKLRLKGVLNTFLPTA